jgi:hypothetical protein
MNRQFDREKLDFWKESLAFVAWVEPILSTGCTKEVRSGIRIRIRIRITIKIRIRKGEPKR